MLLFVMSWVLFTRKKLLKSPCSCNKLQVNQGPSVMLCKSPQEVTKWCHFFMDKRTKVLKYLMLDKTLKILSATKTDSYNVSDFAHTYTQTAAPLRANTHNCPSLSHSSTFSPCLFENPLNNLDLLNSAKTQESQSYDVIRVTGRDCDAYTARLPMVFEQAPTLFSLTYWSSYRTVGKQRSWSQKHRIDHFLLNCQVTFWNVYSINK